MWKYVKEFAMEEDAVGVVEIILILVVLISLVIIFKEQLTATCKKILTKITKQSNNDLKMRKTVISADISVLERRGTPWQEM